MLNLHDLFDGIFYCDYSIRDFHCKPEPPVFEMVMKLHGVQHPSQCYFIDDSVKNVKYASEIGWNCLQLVEQESNVPGPVRKVQKASEIIQRFPELCNK